MAPQCYASLGVVLFCHGRVSIQRFRALGRYRRAFALTATEISCLQYPISAKKTTKGAARQRVRNCHPTTRSNMQRRGRTACMLLQVVVESPALVRLPASCLVHLVFHVSFLGEREHRT